MAITWKDSVGTNHLTPSATPPSVAPRGPLGIAARLIATNSESLSGIPYYAGSSHFLTMWVYGDASGTAIGKIFDVASSQGPDFPVISATIANGSLTAFGADQSENISTAVVAMAPGSRWHFIVLGYSDTSISATVNGVAGGGDAFQDAVASASSDGVLYGTCNIANVGLWINGGANVYNNGNGKRYADLTVAEKVDLVSYWNLDEISGVRYNSHTTVHLTDGNTVGSTCSGPMGVTASFIGGNVEKLSGLNQLSGTQTFSFWVRPRTASGYKTVFVCGTTWCYINQTTGTIYAQITDQDNTPITITTTEQVDAGQWAHVILWYDPADSKLRASVNGGSATTSSALVNPPVLISAQTLLIGAAAGDTNRFDGEMANFGLWSRLLSAPERLSMFNSGNGKSYGSLSTAEKVDLTSYWNLDEISGPRVDSVVASGNDLTDNDTVGSVINAGSAMNSVAAQTENHAASNLSLADASLHFNQKFSMNWWQYGTFDGNDYLYVKNDTPYIILVNGNQLYFGSDGSTYWRDLTVASSVVAWRMLTIVYDGTLTANVPDAQSENDRLKYYVNGVWATLGRAGGVLDVPANLNDNTGDHYFCGSPFANTGAATRWDELAIWDRPITAAEVTELFNNGRGKFYDDF